jgi:hypothetical protein
MSRRRSYLLWMEDPKLGVHEDLAKHDLPLVDEGDRIEFLGFGGPDNFFDPKTQSYQPIPNQLQPGTRGTVTGFGLGQLHVKWDSGHGISLVIGSQMLDPQTFKPDRFQLLKAAIGPIGPRSRTSSLAERQTD